MSNSVYISPPPPYSQSTNEPAPSYGNALIDATLSSYYNAVNNQPYQRYNNSIDYTLTKFKPHQPLKLYKVSGTKTPIYQIKDKNKKTIIKIRFEEDKTIYLNDRDDLICQSEQVYSTYTKRKFELNLLPVNSSPQLFEVAMLKIDKFLVIIDSHRIRKYLFTFDGNTCKVIQDNDYEQVASFKVNVTETKLGSLIFLMNLPETDMLALTLAFAYTKRTIHKLKADFKRKMNEARTIAMASSTVGGF